MNWHSINLLHLSSKNVFRLLYLVMLCLSIIAAEITIPEQLTEQIQERKINPYALPLLSQYRIHKHQRHLLNLWTEKEKNDENRVLPEPMDRLRRSDYSSYGVLGPSPARRSASHPCRWKLCGAHFGYHSVRRF